MPDGRVADLEKENAELRRRLDTLAEDLGEAVEQQTATAHVLEVVRRSRSDVGPVFQALLDKALQLCGAAFGILWTFDGEWMRAAAIRGATPTYTQFLASRLHRPGPANAHGRLLRGESFVHVEDAAVAVPLRTDCAFLGAIVIYRREVR